VIEDDNFVSVTVSVKRRSIAAPFFLLTLWIVLAKRLNVQLARLKERNANAFMFVDEPGLQFLFFAMAGYGDLTAKGDLDQFFTQVDRPRGIHLFGNPDWDFLLNLDLDVLSLDVYTSTEIFASYTAAIKRFLDRGDVIVWGIVPRDFEALTQEETPSLIQRKDKHHCLK
jgi:hypothetical protein